MELELDVTGIAHGGVGVARDADGRVVFVADAIPGERVRVVLTEAKKSYARGIAVEVLEASPDRVPHIWPEAGIERDPADRAGGAEFGHIALPRQRELKAEVLRDALQRFAGIEREVAVQAAPGDDEVGGLGWRTRVRLHIGADGRPGPYAARSHCVVPVAGLPLAAAGIDAVLAQTFPGEDAVDVIGTADGVRLVIGRQAPSVIEEVVGDRTFRVDDTGFWQVHREAPAVLRAGVRDAIDADRFDPAARNLDLYGGVGLLASALIDLGGSSTRVETVESDARASGHAAENLADAPNVVATVDRVDRWLRVGASSRPPGSLSDREFEGATIVLDPPRSGAGLEIADAITRLGAAQLVYVACDPVALARDAKAIEANGYRLARLTAFDLFPHTHHIEAIATFLPDR